MSKYPRQMLVNIHIPSKTLPWSSNRSTWLSKQTKRKKVIKSPMSENFMGQENRRNSSYQKKGKVDSPHSLLQTFVIAWNICYCLNLGSSIIIICWRNRFLDCQSKQSSSQDEEATDYREETGRRHATMSGQCRGYHRCRVGSWRRQWQFWEKYILFAFGENDSKVAENVLWICDIP